MTLVPLANYWIQARSQEAQETHVTFPVLVVYLWDFAHFTHCKLSATGDAATTSLTKLRQSSDPHEDANETTFPATPSPPLENRENVLEHSGMDLALCEP